MASLLGTWRNYLPVCNGIAIVILSLSVVGLFLQARQLQLQLDNQQTSIHNLISQVKNEQQGEIQQLTEQVQDEHSLTLYQMAGTFTVFTCVLTAFHMSTHLQHYHNALVQRKIIAILWMSPIYAVTSFLGLVFPAADAYLSVLKDFYEAYVIYNFLGFLLAVLSREGAVQILSSSSHPLQPPSRLLSRFYEEPPSSSPEALARAVVTECQLLTLQFVFVRPLTSIMSFLGTALEKNQSGETDDWSDYFLSWRFLVAMITNISVFLAFTGLLKFYHAVRDHLSWLQPFSKFMSIKGIVFLTFWQGLLISILVHLQDEDGTADTPEISTMTNSTASGSAAAATGQDGPTAAERAVEIQNVLICLEMLFFAIAHYCVFPAEEWQPGYQPKSYERPGLGLNDFVSDVSSIVGRRRRREPIQSSSDDGDLETENSVLSSGAEEDGGFRRRSTPPHDLSLSEQVADEDRLEPRDII